MGIYIVRMDHPDGTGWNTHVAEHVRYLQGLIKAGRLIASGPLKDTPLRAGFLIFRAATLDEVKSMIHGDPFTRENLIVRLDIQQWDPLFGQLANLSSQDIPAELQ
ncbi:YciI family protein [Lonsdalea britannica]|uniref:YciI family protein n=1 Tax=Lonsdalea britannica TaxID=1082704 RepID=UPI0026EBED3F|nr:YciI family protein [Lonsdalea britannica]